MICCGSGSDLGKVLVLVPAPDPDNIKHSFPKTIKLHKILPFQFQNQLISWKAGLSFLVFLALFNI